MNPLDILVPPVPLATKARCTTETWLLSCGCSAVPRGVAMASAGDPTWCDAHGSQVRVEIVSPAPPQKRVRTVAPVECEHPGCAGQTHTIPDCLAVTVEGYTLCPEHGLVGAATVLREVLRRGVSRDWIRENARRIDDALLVLDTLRERIAARRAGRA